MSLSSPHVKTHLALTVVFVCVCVFLLFINLKACRMQSAVEWVSSACIPPPLWHTRCISLAWLDRECPVLCLWMYELICFSLGLPAAFPS